MRTSRTVESRQGMIMASGLWNLRSWMSVESCIPSRLSDHITNGIARYSLTGVFLLVRSTRLAWAHGIAAC